MFGIGPQEMVVIVLLLLVIFGPGKVITMARDLGRFVSEARNQVEDFKDELLDGEEEEEDDDDDDDELTGDLHFDGAGDDEMREVEGKELTRGEEDPSTELRARK